MYVKTHKTIKLSKVVDLAPFFFSLKRNRGGVDLEES